MNATRKFMILIIYSLSFSQAYSKLESFIKCQNDTNKMYIECYNKDVLRIIKVQVSQNSTGSSSSSFLVNLLSIVNLAKFCDKTKKCEISQHMNPVYESLYESFLQSGTCLKYLIRYKCIELGEKKKKSGSYFFYWPISIGVLFVVLVILSLKKHKRGCCRGSRHTNCSCPRFNFPSFCCFKRKYRRNNATTNTENNRPQTSLSSTTENASNNNQIYTISNNYEKSIDKNSKPPSYDSVLGNDNKVHKLPDYSEIEMNYKTNSIETDI